MDSSDGVEPCPSVPSDQHGGQLDIDTGPAHDVGNGRAHLDLDHTRCGHRPADGDQCRPGRIRPARPAEPRRAVAGDERDLGQRLGVVHQHRPPPQVEGNRLVDPQDRKGPTPVEPADQGRLLPASRSGPAGAARRSVSGAGRLWSRWARASSIDAAEPPAWSATQTTISDGTDHRGHHLGAVQHQVGCVPQQHAVLGAGRLAFHGVDHHDRVLGRRARASAICQLGGSRLRPARAVPKRRSPRGCGLPSPCQHQSGCRARRGRPDGRDRSDCGPGTRHEQSRAGVEGHGAHGRSRVRRSPAVVGRSGRLPVGTRPALTGPGPELSGTARVRAPTRAARSLLDR